MVSCVDIRSKAERKDSLSRSRTLVEVVLYSTICTVLILILERRCDSYSCSVVVPPTRAYTAHVCATAAAAKDSNGTEEEEEDKGAAGAEDACSIGHKDSATDSPQPGKFLWGPMQL